VVTAGRPGALRPQLGAAQACRSIQHKLSDSAVAIQATWSAGPDNDQRLAESLRGVLRALGSPLAEAARSRGLEPRDIATELTCVLTRLGDGPRRAHLAFGVGAGHVMVLHPGTAPTTILAPDGNGGRSAGTLPASPDSVEWARFETRPGDVVLTCTATTAALLNREEFRGQVTPEWLDGPPGLTRFLAQLNYTDQICTDDRTAIGLWEAKAR
jgi:hypothetical protein